MGVLVIAIIIIIGVKNLFLKSSDKNAYVYLSNGTYELITNLNKDQSFEIASSKSDDIGEYLLAFSPDGKYIYYYTKYDSTSGTGSLCRAEYGRLREDSKKNEQYIEVVATKVFLGFKIVDDGTVIYEKNNNALYCFDGKDSIQIAENIDYFWTDGMEKVVYETSDDFGNRIAYGVKLSDLENPIMLASDYTVFYTPDDFENMMYIKTEEDDTESMYVVGFEKDAEKIAKGARFLAEIEGRKYFLSENEKKSTCMILWRIIIERRMPAYQNLTGIILAYLSIDTDNYTAMIIWKIMIKFIRPVVRRHIFMVDQLRIKNKTTVKIYNEISANGK